MVFETTLNVVWLSLGLLAFANAVRVSRHENAPGKRLKRFHLVGIALILAALFPYISATDDILRVENFALHEHGNSHSRPTPADNLVRLYQTLDSPLVCRVAAVILTFIFLSFVYAPSETLIDRTAPFKTGRSPPVFAAA